MLQERMQTNIAPASGDTATNAASRNISPEAKARQVSGLKPFKKGQSGNPAGRRKETDEEKLNKLVRNYADKAVNAYVACLDDAEAPHSAKIAAATALLDRGFGKAKQEVDMNAKLDISTAFEQLIGRLNGNDNRLIDAEAEVIEAAE